MMWYTRRWRAAKRFWLSVNNGLSFPGDVVVLVLCGVLAVVISQSITRHHNALLNTAQDAASVKDKVLGMAHGAALTREQITPDLLASLDDIIAAVQLEQAAHKLQFASSSASAPGEAEGQIRLALVQLGIKVVDKLPPRPKGHAEFRSDVLNEILHLDIETGIENTVENIECLNVDEVILVRRIQPGTKLAYEVRGWMPEDALGRGYSFIGKLDVGQNAK